MRKVQTSSTTPPLQQNYPAPPSPHQNKHFWPPSKDFSKFFTHPQAGRGVHVMLIQKHIKVSIFTSIVHCKVQIYIPNKNIFVARMT